MPYPLNSGRCWSRGRTGSRADWARRPGRLAGRVVGQLVLQEDRSAAVAAPDDLVLLVVLDGQAVSGHVVAGDREPGVTLVIGPPGALIWPWARIEVLAPWSARQAQMSSMIELLALSSRLTVADTGVVSAPPMRKYMSWMRSGSLALLRLASRHPTRSRAFLPTRGRAS